MIFVKIDDEEFKEMMKSPESIDITKYINGMKMVFAVNEEEEVLAEKIKNTFGFRRIFKSSNKRIKSNRL